MALSGVLTLAAAVCLAQVASAVEAPTIELNDGYRMPTVALGTGRGTARDKPVEEVRHAVLWALQAGYRHVDTAAVYEDEREVGQGVSDAIAAGVLTRDRLFITTKLWSNRHAEDQVVPALRESLEKLGLDYVDLYLIHFPFAMNDDFSAADIDYLETWRGMENAKRLGLAKSIGVSNFNKEQLDRLIANSTIKPAVNQIEVNPTNTQHPLVEHCRARGVAVMAFSPLGFLVSRRDADAPTPRPEEQAALAAMTAKYSKTAPQIVLRYLIQRGVVPIPKSTNRERLAQNIDLFNFELSPEEVATIDGFNRDVRVVNPTQWQNYPHYPFEKN